MTDDELTSGNGSVRMMPVGSEEYKEDDAQGATVPQWQHIAPDYILTLNNKLNTEYMIRRSTTRYETRRTLQINWANSVELHHSRHRHPIWFPSSYRAKVEPGGRGGRDSPGSTSSLCLSPVKCTPLQKRYVGDAGGQGGSKWQVRC